MKLPDRPNPLELTGAEFRELVELATSYLAAFLDSLPQRHSVTWESLDRQLDHVTESMPQSGRPAGELLELLFREVFPFAFNTTGPGYLAYIPGGGLPHAAVADLISLITNRYVGLTAAAPVVARIEATVIRWLCDMAGLGKGSGGFLTSGGSLANWSALIAARESRAPDDFRQGVIYTSSQAHHSVSKAAYLAGFPRAQVRSIDVDTTFRISLSHLSSQLTEDQRNGLRPVAVVAHAGTTNTGAVDDLAVIADLAAEKNLWMHVDAAYGGFFLLTQRGRQILAGIERADSLTLDPHKGLFLPYGTGCLLVRRQDDLRRVFGGRGEYMPPSTTDEDADFCDISPELSRDFRGLRIWLPLKMHGIEPFRQCLDEKLDLARHATNQLRTIPGIEIVAEPQLSIVAFRLVVAGKTPQQLEQLNRQLLQQINASGLVYLSATMLNSQTVLRLCILSFRTHQDRMDECLDLIRQAAAEVAAD